MGLFHRSSPEPPFPPAGQGIALAIDWHLAFQLSILSSLNEKRLQKASIYIGAQILESLKPKTHHFEVLMFTRSESIDPGGIELERKQRGIGGHKGVSFLQISERSGIKIWICIVQIVFVVFWIVVVANQKQHGGAITNTCRRVGDADERVV